MANAGKVAVIKTVLELGHQRIPVLHHHQEDPLARRQARRLRKSH
jgi:hypothetical protein